VFYTYGSWNKEGIGDMNIWKAQPVFMPAFGTDAKTSGGVWGFQAEGWW
jgi:hypothetical protein